MPRKRKATKRPTKKVLTSSQSRQLKRKSRREFLASLEASDIPESIFLQGVSDRSTLFFRALSRELKRLDPSLTAALIKDLIQKDRSGVIYLSGEEGPISYTEGLPSSIEKLAKRYSYHITPSEEMWGFEFAPMTKYSKKLLSSEYNPGFEDEFIDESSEKGAVIFERFLASVRAQGIDPRTETEELDSNPSIVNLYNKLSLLIADMIIRSAATNSKFPASYLPTLRREKQRLADQIQEHASEGLPLYDEWLYEPTTIARRRYRN